MAENARSVLPFDHSRIRLPSPPPLNLSICILYRSRSFLFSGFPLKRAIALGIVVLASLDFSFKSLMK